MKTSAATSVRHKPVPVPVSHHFLYGFVRSGKSGLRTMPYAPAIRQIVEKLNPTYGRRKAKAVFTSAAVLMFHLEFTFSQRAKPAGTPFYKFLSPPDPEADRKAYRPGDSFLEELGWMQSEFYAAFSLIGVRYQSKTSFQEMKKNGNAFIRDDGMEMPYAAVYSPLERYTIFHRNHAKLNPIFSIRQPSPGDVTHPAPEA